MKIKEFFKPTEGKTILFIISLLFIPFIKLYKEVIVMCINAPCPPMLVYQKSQSLLQFLLFYDKSQIYQVSYYNLIIGLIASYLLACLIIFIINKINKIKKK